MLHYQSNAFEGKVSKSFIRTGLHKFGISISDVLRNLAQYLESPLMKQKFIHPTEKLKPKKLGKREFNLVLKYYKIIYPKRKKLPVWKKGMKLTKKWQEMINDVNNLEV